MDDPSAPGGGPLRAYVSLSAQRALLGAIGPAVRGVTLGWHDHVLVIRAYVDGPISEADEHALSCAAAEIMADFPPPWTFDEQIVRRDAPARLDGLDVWAYLRREPAGEGESG